MRISVVFSVDLLRFDPQVIQHTFKKEFLNNKAEAFAVIIGLSLEGVMEATTEYLAGCHFLHNTPEGLAQCNAQTALQKSTRQFIVDLTAAVGVLLIAVLGQAVLIRYGFIDPDEEEEEEEDLSDDEGQGHDMEAYVNSLESSPITSPIVSPNQMPLELPSPVPGLTPNSSQHTLATSSSQQYLEQPLLLED